MTTTTKNPDITVRGGLISVPNSNQPTRPLRHQPNTPPNKKKVTPRTDYQIPETILPAPPDPTPAEPDGDKTNVPVETSESD